MSLSIILVWSTLYNYHADSTEKQICEVFDKLQIIIHYYLHANMKFLDVFFKKKQIKISIVEASIWTLKIAHYSLCLQLNLINFILVFTSFFVRRKGVVFCARVSYVEFNRLNCIIDFWRKSWITNSTIKSAMNEFVWISNSILYPTYVKT